MRLGFVLQQLRFLSISSLDSLYKPTRPYTTRSASDKLFADAAQEEADSNKSRNKSKSQSLTVLEQHENWTGDERIQDAVLRMLVDKYQPLRNPIIITAEEKLNRTPPKVWVPSISVDDGSIAPVSVNTASTSRISHLKPQSGSWATEPLLPSSPTHKPWETTFKAPSDCAPLNIKAARMPPPTAGAGSVLGAPGGIGGLGQGNLDERLMRKEKEKLKKVQRVERLSQALESTLDYRLGVKQGVRRQLNPTTLKGWNSLVEERIEKARSAGVFKHVKGRGQPLVPSVDESNPFIAREEFLMNRIVQRNGAAPPWVEIQCELDTAVKTFREILRQSWVRRAIRLFTMSTSPELLHKVTLGQVKTLRDPEWVKKELSYHETAVAELNSLVRKYNGLAPYHVRRSYYYSREIEIDRMYETSAEDIMEELKARLHDSDFVGHVETFRDAGISDSSSTKGSVENLPRVKWRFRDLIRGWFKDIVSAWSRTSL